MKIHSTISLDEFKQKISIGDLIATTDKRFIAFFAHIIRLFFGSPTHIMVVVNLQSDNEHTSGFEIAESSLTKQVHTQNHFFDTPLLSNILNIIYSKQKKDLYYCELLTPLTSKQKKDLYKYATSLEGQSYPARGIFRVFWYKVTQIFQVESFKEPQFIQQKPFCSEFVYWLLYKINIINKDKYLRNPHPAPSALMKLSEYRIYKVVK